MDKPPHGSTKQRRAKWGRALPSQTLSAGVLTTWQGKWGVPLFSLFLSFSLSRRKQISVSQISLSQVYTNAQLFRLCLGLPSFRSPTPLKYSGIWRHQPCPTQRCQKWGLLPDRGPGPTTQPHPTPFCPSRRLYYLIRSSS